MSHLCYLYQCNNQLPTTVCPEPFFSLRVLRAGLWPNRNGVIVCLLPNYDTELKYPISVIIISATTNYNTTVFQGPF